MTVGAGLLLALAGIGLVIYVIGAVAAGFLGIANSVSEALSVLAAGRVGRKNLGVKASIPKELLKGSEPLPESDPDKAALLAYKPAPRQTEPRSAVSFNSPSTLLFRERGAPSTEIDIEQVPAILAMDAFRPFEPAFAILNEVPAYPEPPPDRPQDIEPPPAWTPWRPAFGDPVFHPPLWEGWRSILNSYVLSAHADELAKVRAAQSRKEVLLVTCERRNREVEKLAEKARKAFEQAASEQAKSFDAATAAHQRGAVAFEAAFMEEQSKMKGLQAEAVRPGSEGLTKRIELAMKAMDLPSFASTEGETNFDESSGIVIHEHRFPDLSGAEWVKFVELKSGWTKKPANQKEKREAAARLHPSLCLRLAAEIARLDDDGIVQAVAVNGWADYTEKSTGQRKRAYCASLFATKEQILKLNLSALDPLDAFSALKGVSARSMEMTPIAPVIRLDTQDPRFVDAREILSRMAEGENLAAMDWESFEHLCRELFERAFADSGAEVKVTQASRDQGVDAIVFDPDPLRGGKIIVQAKRYTNTVDVSAVRDLYGAVINEGAVKGILVTTSSYGPESYSFAKDKPLTLINGNELLGLLEKHGYKFRINLAEAKALL